jgi:hypothetical protein
MMRKPGGMRIGDALLKAAANLELIREPCLEDVDEQLERLDRLSSQGGESPDDDLKLEMYRCGNDIHAIAGVFGLVEMGAAAFSLCELIDRLRTSGGWTKPAVDVHLSSLHLLRHPADEDRASVVEGLIRLTDKVAPIGATA